MTRDDLQIHSIIIRDGESGETLCRHPWTESWANEEEQCVLHIPISVLDLSTVSRELIFHSKDKFNNLHIVQRIMSQRQTSTCDGMHAEWTCLEEWVFTFGFVIPGSTNSWQSIIASAKKEPFSPNIRGAEFVIETNFYDDNLFICDEKVRVRYV